MQFIHHDLGHLSRGEIIEVTLRGTAANVRLMDTTNFNSYRAGRKHRCFGGHVKRSPYRIQIPRSGRWHVAVDLGGLPGRVKSSVQVLPGMLSPARDVPLSAMPSLIRDFDDRAVEATRRSIFDVFISHASEDKDTFVRPLAHALRDRGLDVWFDEFTLRIGDSLRRSIDQGLASSRFGIVVLSPSFFHKDWPNYELDGLVTGYTSGDQVLLPIWHNVTKSEVKAYSPTLADKVARDTAIHSIEEIVDEIAALVRPEQD